MKLRDILEKSTFSGTFKIFSEIETNPMEIVVTKEQALAFLSQELLETKAVNKGYALTHVNIELQEVTTNLFNDLINELKTYSTCEILEYSPSIKAAKINIQLSTFNLYTKNNEVWVGYTNKSGEVHNYRLRNKSASDMVDELYILFG